MLNLFDLKNKTAVVTGAGSGIGRAMAEAMAEAGANVACLDIDRKRAEETSELVRSMDVESIPVTCDVSSDKLVGKAFEQIKARFGRVDVLFNNAGISGQNVNTHEVSIEEWNRVISTDLTGIFLCAKEAIGIMLEQKRPGKIINVASIFGYCAGAPLLKVPPYHAAKGGIISLTREMALEYAQNGINVNCILPGFFATNLSSRMMDEKFVANLGLSIPIGRVGVPEEIKGTALFLASAASNYLTGSIIAVDGGYICK